MKFIKLLKYCLSYISMCMLYVDVVVPFGLNFTDYDTFTLSGNIYLVYAVIPRHCQLESAHLYEILEAHYILT